MATHNEGKLQELQSMINDKGIVLESLSQYCAEAAEETGSTFIENAIIKAKHATNITQLAALADDSGLVIPSLNNQPGIISARFAGAAASDKDNRDKLVKVLKHNNLTQVKAYYYCALAYLRTSSDPCPIITTGIWHGYIKIEEKGESGFGYDKLFYDPKLSLYAAEMPKAVKNTVSHRSQATKKVLHEIYLEHITNS